MLAGGLAKAEKIESCTVAMNAAVYGPAPTFAGIDEALRSLTLAVTEAGLPAATNPYAAIINLRVALAAAKTAQSIPPILARNPSKGRSRGR